MAKKPSELATYIKGRHFGGKPRELTISHVGLEPKQAQKQEITMLAGDDAPLRQGVASTSKILWFKETGLSQKMRLNDTNLDYLIEHRGDDFKLWIGCRVTFAPKEMFAFGKKQVSVEITSVKSPDTKAASTESVNKVTGELPPSTTPDGDWGDLGDSQDAPSGKQERPTRKQPPLSPAQRNKLTELQKILRPAEDIEIDDALDARFVQVFQHGMKDATYEEGARITGAMMTELRQKQTA